MQPRRTESDRVRSEVGFHPSDRSKHVGRAVRGVLADVAARGTTVDIDDIDQACLEELARRPVRAPKQLARPLTQISTNATQGVRLLPPLEWHLVGADVDLPSKSRIPLVFGHDEPLVVGDHIGDLVGYEVRLAAAVDTADLPEVQAHVAMHLDGLVEVYGSRVLGVVTLCLGHYSGCVLTLADDARTSVAYSSTPLCIFPGGRLS